VENEVLLALSAATGAAFSELLRFVISYYKAKSELRSADQVQQVNEFDTLTSKLSEFNVHVINQIHEERKYFVTELEKRDARIRDAEIRSAECEREHAEAHRELAEIRRQLNKHLKS